MIQNWKKWKEATEFYEFVRVDKSRKEQTQWKSFSDLEKAGIENCDMAGSGHLRRNSLPISWPKWSWTQRTNNSTHGYCPSKCTTWSEEGITVSIDGAEFRREKLFAAATTSASTSGIDNCHFSLPCLMIWTVLYKLRWQLQPAKEPVIITLKNKRMGREPYTRRCVLFKLKLAVCWVWS